MIERKLWHKSLTDEVIMSAHAREAMTLDDPGFCLICGHEASSVEPDAENYECESCGAEQVFGTHWLLMEIS